MPDAETRGIGKCAAAHLGSYGFPTRPPDPYPFCPQCGTAMIWVCPKCESPVPDDPQELETANYCRSCGAAYFDAAQDGANDS